MIHVSILVLKNAVAASVTDAYRVFTTVNQWQLQDGKEAVFDITMVSQWHEVVLGDGVVCLRTDNKPADVQHTNLLIIPAMNGDMITATYLNKGYAGWISKQYKNGAAVASLCAGAFLLAFTGLLNGRECTTHWDYVNEFRSFYPATRIVEEKTFTAQDGIYTSGGGNAYWNLLLYLVEKYTDRATAIQLAKYFVIDINRMNQSPFVVFKGYRKHDDAVIKNIQEYIETHYYEKLTVAELSEKFNLTKRTLERRFSKATYMTTGEYIQRVKIEAAKKLLETERKSINDVMLDVGYMDTQAFRTLFKKITNMTPIAYRNIYVKP